jgi:hypothetical protein
MNEAVNQGEKGALKTTLLLRVDYAPAKKPLVEPQIDGSMTLAQVKTLAMGHFSVVEGDVAGGTKMYVLSFDDIVQSNLSVTLGSLVKRGHQVELLLIEQFIQG